MLIKGGKVLIRNIREATKEDIQSLCYLIKELNGSEISYSVMENRLKFIEDSPFDFLYVYEEIDSILGMLGFRIRENIEDLNRFGEISIISVDSNARRKGVGRSLMEFAEELANKHQCVGTWLVSGMGRKDEAHRFYKDLGYEITGYRFVKRLIHSIRQEVKIR